MGAQGADALEVLRDLWRSQAQTDLDLGDDCETKACKKMSDAGVGFDDFAGAGEADRSAAWRARQLPLRSLTESTSSSSLLSPSNMPGARSGGAVHAAMPLPHSLIVRPPPPRARKPGRLSHGGWTSDPARGRFFRVLL